MPAKTKKAVAKKPKKMSGASGIPHVSISIPALSEYVGVARLAISGVASRLDFSVEQIEDIKVAVTEACANAVQYAYGNNGREHTDKTVTISCSTFKDRLEIAVRDEGIGFDAKNPPPPDKGDGHTHLGLGITFMRTLMDKADIDSKKGKGTTVTLVKYVAPAHSA